MALPVIYHRYADKTNFYNQIIGAKTTFTSLTHEEHTISRRRISPPYAPALLKQFEAGIDIWLQRWTDKVRDEFSQTGKFRDFNDQLMWLAYDMLADLTFGRPFGFLAAHGDVKGIIKGAGVSIFLHQLVALVPSLLWLLRNTWLGYFVLPKRDKNFGYGYLMAEAERLTLSDEINPPGKRTLLRMYLETKSTDGKTMGVERMASEARVMLIGGAEPIASTTIELLLNILGKPGCYEKLVAEIDKAESDGLFSNPVATIEEAQSLPYFTACLRETMRGAESTITMMPRVVSKGGVQVLGQFIPEGTHVSATPWITHRNRAMYGEDAELFRPERWLEASPEQLRQWNKYDFQFGYGARICPGKAIGLMILHKQCLQILRHFKIRKLNEDCPLGDCFTRQLDDKIQRDTGLFIEQLRARKGTVKKN